VIVKPKRLKTQPLGFKSYTSDNLIFAPDRIVRRKSHQCNTETDHIAHFLIPEMRSNLCSKLYFNAYSEAYHFCVLQKIKTYVTAYVQWAPRKKWVTAGMPTKNEAIVVFKRRLDLKLLY